MYRRDFIKKTVFTGAALSLPSGADIVSKSVFAAERPDLAVVRGSSPAHITKTAIDALGGISKFIARGDVVVIKPNMSWDRLPEQAANTNPEVVASIIKQCFEAGAKTVKVFDRPVNDPRRCYEQSAVAPAARALGAEVSYMDERKFKEMSISGLALKKWPIYKEVVEADKVINVPIAKHHGLAKLTMSMKNWMGVIGGRRNKIHQRLDESLVDLANFIKPALTVLDAVRILTDNGPQGGDLADVKQVDTVIVGVDQVAIDSFGATLFGIKGGDLGYVRIGAEHGVGVMDIDKMNITKINLS